MPKEEKYKQKYTKLWEREPVLKEWISPVLGDDFSVLCKYCQAILKTHKKDLLAHANSAKHQKCVKLNREAKTSSMSRFVAPAITDSHKEAELKIAVFLAEHGSIASVDHQTEMLPSLDPKSDLLKQIKIHRTKCTH